MGFLSFCWGNVCVVEISIVVTVDSVDVIRFECVVNCLVGSWDKISVVFVDDIIVSVVGLDDGWLDGKIVGNKVGNELGIVEGFSDGMLEGILLGPIDGICVGTYVIHSVQLPVIFGHEMDCDGSQST